MYSNTFKYTPKDVSCQLCTEYVKKLGCTALRCPWLAERIEAGVVGYREAVLETFPHERRLFQRLNLLIKHYPGSLWSNEQHERRMQYQCAVQGYRRRRDTIAKLLEQLKNDRQKHQYSKANPHGKMTVKQLAAKDKGLQSIEVTDQNIGSFNRIARKYGIDFAPFKVKGEKRYMVFFKAPDADAMTAAFKEYTTKQVRKAERPSVLEKLQHFKSLIQAAVVDRTKRKELER